MRMPKQQLIKMQIRKADSILKRKDYKVTQR